MMKKCSKCDMVKPLTEYYNHKSSPTGKQGICKSCSDVHSAEWRVQNRDKYNAYYRKWYAKSRGKGKGKGKEVKEDLVIECYDKTVYTVDTPQQRATGQGSPVFEDLVGARRLMVHDMREWVDGLVKAYNDQIAILEEGDFTPTYGVYRFDDFWILRHDQPYWKVADGVSERPALAKNVGPVR